MIVTDSKSEYQDALATEARAATPLFTVVIPTFNYGRYLGRAVHSVLTQSFDGWELVIADDGSTDSTESIARTVNDRRVRYLRQANAGPFAAVQAAFGVTGAPWVVVFDADDELQPGALEALRAAVTAHPHARAVVGPWLSVDRSGRRTLEPFVAPEGSRINDFRGVLSGRLRFATGAAALSRGAVARYAQWKAPVRHGVETMIFAHLALEGGLAIVGEPLLAVHDHRERLRDNLASIVKAGTGLVDAVFDPAFVGAEAMKYRSEFLSFMERERSRTFYRAGCYKDAAEAFERAVAASPKVAIDSRSLRRWLVSRGRCIAARPGLDATRRAEAIARSRRDTPVPPLTGGTMKDFRADPFGTVLNASRSCGDVALLDLWTPTYLLSHPQDIRHVLMVNSYNYDRCRFSEIRRLFGGGIISDNGPSHLTQRRLCQPFYTPRAASETVGPAMVCLARLTANWNDGDVVNIAAEFIRLNVGLSGLTVLGVQSQQESEELFEMVNKTLIKGVKMMACPFHLPESIPTRRHRLYKRYAEELDARVGAIIDQRASDAGQDDEGGTFIDHLLRARSTQRELLDRQRLIDHAKTMFVATSEPIATPTASALWRLTVHAEHEARLLEEARAVFGDRHAQGEDVDRLAFATAFWRESLRLHPSNWLMPRRAVAADTLPGGLKIEPGREVFISQYALHHDERYFPDAERFDPARFSPEAVAARGRDTFLPFGRGPRGCIGASLAEQVGVAILSTLTRDWHFERVDGGDPVMFTPNLFISLIKDSRLLLRVRRRARGQGASPA